MTHCEAQEGSKPPYGAARLLVQPDLHSIGRTFWPSQTYTEHRPHLGPEQHKAKALVQVGGGVADNAHALNGGLASVG